MRSGSEPIGDTTRDKKLITSHPAVKKAVFCNAVQTNYLSPE
jgi:hypothetical protein